MDEKYVSAKRMLKWTLMFSNSNKLMSGSEALYTIDAVKTAKVSSAARSHLEELTIRVELCS